MFHDIRKVYPQVLKDDATWQAVESFLVDNWNYFMGKFLEMPSLFRPEQTQFPIEMAEFFGAYLANGDTLTDVINKLFNATYTHQNLPHFDNVWKPIIDEIYGQNSYVYKGNFFSEPFIIGVDKVGDLVHRIGPGDYPIAWIPGMVLIDVDTGVAGDAAQIKRTIEQFREMQPSHMPVYFGYETTIGMDTGLKLFLSLRKEGAP